MNQKIAEMLKSLSVSERVEAMNVLATSTVQLKDIFPNLGQTTLPMPQVKRGPGRPRKVTLAPPVEATATKQEFQARKYEAGEIGLKPGDKVRVPRGTLITFPDAPEKKPREMQRSRTVTVREIQLGGENKEPTVLWVGSGNYKRQTSINNIIKSA